MPGLDVLKAIKEISPHTECIILTGFASTESAIQAVNLGAYSYLQKPYDVDQLIVTIQRALEIKETTQSLSESETRYHQLYEGTIDGIVATDTSGKIIDSNTSFQKMLRYSGEKLRTMTIWDITPKKWHEKNKNVRDQILSRGYSDLYEKEYIDKNGSIIPVEVSGFVTRNAQNEVIGMWAFVRDISGRKKSEADLRRQLLEVSALHGIASSGTEVANIDELLQRSTEILQETLYSDNFGILIYDEFNKTLKPHLSYIGLDKTQKSIERSIEIGITGGRFAQGNHSSSRMSGKTRIIWMLTNRPFPNYPSPFL
jgi:PAS domain S-box-containing protein